MNNDQYELQSLINDAEHGSVAAAETLMGYYESENKRGYYAILAANNGSNDPDVLALAGGAYFLGTASIKQDYTKARAFFEANMASSCPSFYVASVLGCMYFEGAGGSTDFEKGEECLRYAMKNDNDEEAWEATANLGNYLCTKCWQFEKKAEGIELLKIVADRGSVDAQINLGKAYYEKRDKESARRYWELAAQQGSDIARNNLQVLEAKKKRSSGCLVWIFVGIAVILLLIISLSNL